MQKQTVKPATLYIALALLAYASMACAFIAPTNSAALGYDFFDFANKLSSGAVGFAIGIGGVAMAGFFLFRQQVMPACACLFGIIAILKSTSIVTSLGSLM
jgi:hypothetical protein